MTEEQVSRRQGQTGPDAVMGYALYPHVQVNDGARGSNASPSCLPETATSTVGS